MLYKRGKNWWVRFSVRGREIRVTSGTDRKALAEEFERRLREQIWRETELGEVHYTWEEATKRWLHEKAHKRSLERDRETFEIYGPELNAEVLADLTAERIRGAISAREIVQGAAGAAQVRKILPGTANRHVAAIRAVLNACVKWGWLTQAPKIERFHVDKCDPRWISVAQLQALLAELPPHLARMAGFAVATGLRWSNISGLRWELVDLDRAVAHVPGGETKNRRPIPVPLSSAAVAILRDLVGVADNRSGYVFTDHKGRSPVGSPKTAWGKAVKRAGLQGFRFHDLRHTWAAWHTMNGTPPIILKELGGWSSLSMVERYSALNPGHLSEWADNNSRTKNGTTET
jgi:integrase